jgi:urate oxidase
MAIVLGPNQYGKAETRVVRVERDGGRYQLTDLNVSMSLAGDLADSHLRGNNAQVLPTDSQKNTVYAFARKFGIGQIEDFGLLLARHFVDSQPAIERARVHLEQYPWHRVGEHSFLRDGTETRTATVTHDGQLSTVVGGLTGLTLFNCTGSEFRGYVKDPYTTLPEAGDRILATAVDARWRYATGEGDWLESYRRARSGLVEAFTQTYSMSLQQTLFAMGQRVLERCPEIVEIRLALPNKHHILVDLRPFGMDNPDQVYHVADRPYGLIEGTVHRDDAPEPGLAWW